MPPSTHCSAATSCGGVRSNCPSAAGRASARGGSAPCGSSARDPARTSSVTDTHAPSPLPQTRPPKDQRGVRQKAHVRQPTRVAQLCRWTTLGTTCGPRAVSRGQACERSVDNAGDDALEQVLTCPDV